MAQAPCVPVDNDVAYFMRRPHIHGGATDFAHNVHTFFYERLWRASLEAGAVIALSCPDRLRWWCR